MSDCHLYLAIPKYDGTERESVPLLIFVYLVTKSVYFSINKWREAGHPQVFEGNTSKYSFFKARQIFRATDIQQVSEVLGKRYLLAALHRYGE